MRLICKSRCRLDGKAPANSAGSRPLSEAQVTDAPSDQTDGGSSASRRVLMTMELVELILLHLNMFDILRCTMVCTGFRDIVSWSIAIQKKLFLIPADQPETWLCEYKPWCDHHFILKQKIANACLRPQPGYHRPRQGDMEFTPIRMNPLFKSSSGPHSSGIEFDESGFPILHRNRGPGGTCQLDQPIRNALNKSASWRRMFISDPPVGVEAFWIAFDQEPDAKHPHMRWMTGCLRESNPQVRTLGELVDRMQDRGTIQWMHRKNQKMNLDWHRPGAVGEKLRKWAVRDTRDIRLTFHHGMTCLRDCIIPSEEQWELPYSYPSTDRGQL